MTTTMAQQDPLSAIPTLPHPLNDDYQYVRLSISKQYPAVTIVALDRPTKRNAMNATMWKEMGHVFSVLGRTGDGCRCVLLTGVGSCCSAGIDVTDPTFLMTPPGTNTEHVNVNVNVAHTGLTFLPKLRQMQACLTAVETCPVPVVAAIHGYCVGAGVDLVSCADVRLCHCRSVFGVAEVALGLAADVGTLQRWPKITGNQSLVRELCLTGRNFDAATAEKLGLVSTIVSEKENVVLTALHTVCAKIIPHSPVAVQGTKEALLYARDHSVADGLEQVAAYNALALQSDDLVAAWTARATKTKPTFANLPAFSKL
jgi:delta(3,5)-delta(2,4)-dienoyl-CoA isomerase